MTEQTLTRSQVTLAANLFSLTATEGGVKQPLRNPELAGGGVRRYPENQKGHSRCEEPAPRSLPVHGA